MLGHDRRLVLPPTTTLSEEWSFVEFLNIRTPHFSMRFSTFLREKTAFLDPGDS